MKCNLSIVFFLNNVSDSSIPLEIATSLSNQGIDVVVCSYFQPDEFSFDIQVKSLDADKQIALRPYLKLYRYLCSYSPDVLHVHPNATGALARIIGQLAGVPHIISTEHSPHERFGLTKNVLNGGTNWLNDILVANSQSTADSIRSWERWLLSAGGTDLRVIHNGVNSDRIDAEVDREPFDFSGEPVIGTVGRLAPIKNHRRLVRAAAPILRESETILAIVGDGPEQDKIQTTAAQEEVDDSIRLLGHQPRDVVYGFLNQIDIFAFPSLAEGFGVAVVEAMAAGVPPAVSDIPVMNEVVDDAGVTFDPRDVAAIRTALRTLIVDQEKRRTLGERAGNRARTQFPLGKTATAYARLYRKTNRESP